MLDEIAEVIEPVLLMTPPNPGKLAFGEMFQYGKFLWKNKPNLKKKLVHPDPPYGRLSYRYAG